MSVEREGLDRFMLVREGRETIFSCFLEYQTETVVVHDLIHSLDGDTWSQAKSAHTKLRLEPSWVRSQLESAGLEVESMGQEGDMVTIIARKWRTAVH